MNASYDKWIRFSIDESSTPPNPPESSYSSFRGGRLYRKAGRLLEGDIALPEDSDATISSSVDDDPPILQEIARSGRESLNKGNLLMG